ncbi:unnamed protein product [Peronospora destructor]|uniref:Uncharacterized protein n=1 Tax=Peronospora destructor TaxID=86335 RepID=A0AAV0TWJ4_9STRA|nr:unnamed protein product [Peronospora destructor]
MTYDLKATNSSGEEDEELMFPFEEEDDDFFLHSQGSCIFHPIDGVDIERPADPLVAIFEYQEAIDGQNKESIQEPHEEKQVAVTPVPRSRKRKTLQLPNAPAQIICPVAKRLKSSVYERGITAPASLMGSLSLDWTRDRYHQQIGKVCQLVENKTDKAKVPFRSASVKISNRFQPILWPGDALVSHIMERDDSHLCSSSSSSKSWTSGLELVCRRSLDVSSPVCECFNDLALHS